jgi:hypothetical protein
VDDDVYRQARVAAAREGTSVSAIVAKYLTALANGSAPVLADSKGHQEQSERAELVNLFREAHPVLGYKPNRQKSYER